MISGTPLARAVGLRRNGIDRRGLEALTAVGRGRDDDVHATLVEIRSVVARLGDLDVPVVLHNGAAGVEVSVGVARLHGVVPGRPAVVRCGDPTRRVIEADVDVLTRGRDTEP